MKLNGEEEITTPYHGRWMVGACSDEAPKVLVFSLLAPVTCTQTTNNHYIYILTNEVGIVIIIT